MSILAKIRFTPNATCMYFEQYYEVTSEQHLELIKLNFTYGKHTCRSNLSNIVKQYNIDCSEMKLVTNSSCSFCQCGLKELRYIDYIKVDKPILPSTSFALESLLFISKEESILSSYVDKIDELVTLKKLEIAEMKRQDLQLRENEAKLSNQWIYPAKCSELRQNGFAMIQDHPCKIVMMTTSKD